MPDRCLLGWLWSHITTTREAIPILLAERDALAARLAALEPLARAAVIYSYRTGCSCHTCRAIAALDPALRAELEAES